LPCHAGLTGAGYSHYADFKSRPQITLDDWYGEFKWVDLLVVSNEEKSNPYCVIIQIGY